MAIKPEVEHPTTYKNIHKKTSLERFLQYIKGRPVAIASIAVLVIMYLSMIFAPLITPADPTQTHEGMSFHPANIEWTKKGLKVREYRMIDKSRYYYARVTDECCAHDLKIFSCGRLFSCEDYPVFLLGADNLGRDLYTRIVFGSRISLTIGFVATFLSLILAILLGGVSGYFSGATDWAIMRFAEFFMLIPSLYFILFLRSCLNTKLSSGTSYMIITIILSLVGWPGTARTIRGLTASIKENDYIKDAQLSGVPSVVIIFRYIIPQISSLLIVSVALSVPAFIMSETTLSYLGLGISDPSVSWGSLINRDISTLSNLRNFPWLLWPACMLLLVTLAFNFLGDALRDFFDPYSGNILKVKSKERLGKNDSPNKTFELPKKDPLPPNAIITVRNLNISFFTPKNGTIIKEKVIHDVSFDLLKEEVLGIVGESGSGKSVTTTALIRLLGANAVITGDIYYKEKKSEIDDEIFPIMSLEGRLLRKIRGREIALVSQEPSRAFDPLQSIESAFIEAMEVKDKDKAGQKEKRSATIEKAIQLLEEVGIQGARERIKNFPHQFSGGQLQRIAIALNLSQDPKVLIADEITTALDVTTQAEIISLLLKLRKDRGLSIIFITHNIDLVMEIADRVLVMLDGHAVECAPTKEILSAPKHPYTAALLKSRIHFGDHYTKGALNYITTEERKKMIKDNE